MDILSFILENLVVSWAILGVFLLSAEIILPGVHLLWLGLASLITGFISIFLPDNLIIQIFIFALLSIVSVYTSYRSGYTKHVSDPSQKQVNRRGYQHIGKIYTVIDAIENGRGRIRVGDSQWLAQGPDCAIGTPVKVIDMDGSVMIVTLSVSAEHNTPI